MNGWQLANGASAIALGAYVITVCLSNGGRERSLKLWRLVSGEAGFVKWGIAAAILYWLSSRKEIGELGAGIIALVVVGLAMKIASDPAILSGIERAWNVLPDTSKAKG